MTSSQPFTRGRRSRAGRDTGPKGSAPPARLGVRLLLPALSCLLALGVLLARPAPAAAFPSSGFSLKYGAEWTRTARLVAGDEGFSPFFRPGVVVWDGGSILEGLHSPADGTPAARVGELVPHPFTSYLTIVHGAKIGEMLVKGPTEVDARYQAEGDANVCVAMPGGSDLANGTTEADLEDGVRAYCEARRAAGFAVVLVTLLPRDAEAFEERRQAYNAFLRDHWTAFADGLADLAADPRIGDPLDCWDLRYYLVDRTHPTAAGDAVIAGIIAPVVNALSWRSSTCEMRLRSTDGPWSDWRAYSPRTVWFLEAGDGEKTVEAEYRDEGDEPVLVSDGIKLDTVGPATWAHADVSVRRGRRASLAYHVLDPAPGSETATVWIVVKDRAGKVVKRLALGTRTTGSELRARFTCVLRAGRYTWYVHAKDGAGNRETRTGHRRLTVK